MLFFFFIFLGGTVPRWMSKVGEGGVDQREGEEAGAEDDQPEKIPATQVIIRFDCIQFKALEVGDGATLGIAPRSLPVLNRPQPFIRRLEFVF